MTMGQSPNGACYTDNPNDAVLVQGNADLKDGWVSPRVWTTEVTKTAKAGDLIMSVRAPVGAMGKTAYDVVLGRGVAGIAGNEFLFQALSKKEAEGYWSTVSAGSTFDSINGDELRNTLVDCPRSELECETIGDCLSKVDSLITLHQRKRCNGPFTHPLVWEQRKLGDCFDFLQNNTLSRADLNLESGSARNIHYGDILIKFGDCLGLGSDKLPFVDDESILSKYVNSTLRVGDVIFADTAEDESAGKCVELVKLPNEPVISGLHTIPARPKFPFGSGYLGHYLNAPAYHDQLLPLLQGIKVVSISKTALQDTQICFPTALEQSAIGASLNALDSLITLHQ